MKITFEPSEPNAAFEDIALGRVFLHRGFVCIKSRPTEGLLFAEDGSAQVLSFALGQRIYVPKIVELSIRQ